MDIITLDGVLLAERTSAMDHLTEALSLPDWWGRNLDALYDCLTELGEETLLRVTHRAALEEKLGPTARGLWRVLKDAEAENPWLQVEE